MNTRTYLHGYVYAGDCNTICDRVTNRETKMEETARGTQNKLIGTAKYESHTVLTETCAKPRQ